MAGTDIHTDDGGRSDPIAARIDAVAVELYRDGHPPIDILAVMLGWATAQSMREIDGYHVAAHLRELADRCEAAALPTQGCC